ncbi:unnamed protein product [Calicophoron daubneyi]|uniref:Decaprenyl-diphosphate synthase subunit 2 n=1 Tax=Calicophoron daubneyi TaxID=300641 RepID=A0AAV2T7U2_CALDB
MTSSWINLINRAEKLLGGPAPFINLSSLLTSEAGFLAARARRLAASTNHPLFAAVQSCLRGQSFKSVFPLSKTNAHDKTASQRPSGGLIILLIGQSYSGVQAGSTKLCSEHRKLAELFETVHTAIAIHKSIVNPVFTKNEEPPVSTTDGGEVVSEVEREAWAKDIEVGNKLATLAGDVLLASVSTTLASFYSPKVVDVVSESIGNMIEAEFLPIALQFVHRDTQFNTSRTGSASDVAPAWLDYVSLSRGSLLGGCCQSAVLLSERYLAESGEKPKLNPSLEPSAPSLLARRLGHDWACLLRLVEEKEFVNRAWLRGDRSDATSSVFKTAKNSRAPSRLEINFHECGLPELTFADAFLEQQLNGEVREYGPNSTHATVFDNAADVLHGYDQIGSKLADDLHNSVRDFSASSRRSISSGQTAPIAMELLVEMAEQLISDTLEYRTT